MHDDDAQTMPPEPTNTPAERSDPALRLDLIGRTLEAAEYRLARAELAALASCVARIAAARSEQEAIDYARIVRSKVGNVAVRWSRARAMAAAVTGDAKGAVNAKAFLRPDRSMCPTCGEYFEHSKECAS